MTRALHAQLTGGRLLAALIVAGQIRSSSAARSFSSRSTIAQPSRPGAAVTGSTSADPGPVPRSASATDTQNRCGSRSSRCTATHPARSARPDSLIQDRSSTVFPLPAGAETSVTRLARSSRPNNRGR